MRAQACHPPRREATAGQLGNQVGVMPVTLPAGGAQAGRITQIATITRQRKTAAHGSSVPADPLVGTHPLAGAPRQRMRARLVVSRGES